MTNALTSVAMVNSMTSNDFSADTDLLSAILATCFVFITAIKGSTIVKTGSDWTNYVIPNDGEAISLAMLVEAKLLDGRRVLKSRSFGSGNATARSTSKLFTQEMRDMLISPEEVNDAQWDFSNEQPSEHWDVSGR